MSSPLQVILARYLGGKSTKPYAFLVPPWIEPVEKFDVLVVETRDTVALVKVTSTKPTEKAASYASAYVVHKLDLAHHYDEVRALTGDYS